MSEPSPDDSHDVHWCSRHWWSRDYALIASGKTVASVRFRRRRGTAVLGARCYDLSISREGLFSFITIRESASDDLVARMQLVPLRGGYQAELADGELFQWGWVKWWRRRWAWTNEAGETVISSRRSKSRGRYELHLEPPANTRTWPLLALLELAANYWLS